LRIHARAFQFPARVDGLFRPHYVTWSEQQRIEFAAPEYLRNVIRIVTETGLRIYKELTPIKSDELDLVNRTVWIRESKTPNGVADVPLTDIAADAFRIQLAISGPGFGTVLTAYRQRNSESYGRPIDGLLWNQQEEWSGRGDSNARPPAPKELR